VIVEIETPACSNDESCVRPGTQGRKAMDTHASYSRVSVKPYRKENLDVFCVVPDLFPVGLAPLPAPDLCYVQRHVLGRWPLPATRIRGWPAADYPLHHSRVEYGQFRFCDRPQQGHDSRTPKPQTGTAPQRIIGCPVGFRAIAKKLPVLGELFALVNQYWSAYFTSNLYVSTFGSAPFTVEITSTLERPLPN
jgi:hypothetical protein